MTRVWLWLLLGLAWPAFAWQVDEADFKARLVLAQPKGYLGQEIGLSLDIATPHWFKRAARLTLPSQPDILWLQRQVFADNRRERINGEMWTVQRWSLSVFPRQAGQLALSPVSLSVGVADEQGDAQIKQVTLSGLNLLGVPLSDMALAASQYRVAVSVNDQQDITSERVLEKGQSLKITYRSEAELSLAMLLPDITPALVNDDVSLYTELPLLENISERGQRRAIREDRFTVVANKKTTLFIAGQDIAWLDVTTGQRRQMQIPAIGQAASNPPVFTTRSTVIGLGVVTATMIIVGVIFVARRVRSPNYRQRKALQGHCLAAAEQGDWQALASSLYALINTYPDYRRQAIRVTLQQCCSPGDAARLIALLGVAYSGQSAFVDVDDAVKLKHLFKGLAKRKEQKTVEANETPFLR